jgi:hypothetical protein
LHCTSAVFVACLEVSLRLTRLGDNGTYTTEQRAICKLGLFNNYRGRLIFTRWNVRADQKQSANINAMPTNNLGQSINIVLHLFVYEKEVVWHAHFSVETTNIMCAPPALATLTISFTAFRALSRTGL